MIYLDNAATSYPKPEEVYKAVDDCMRNAGANPGRSGHSMSVRAGKIVLETRQLTAQLIGAKTNQVVFTQNATDSINLALKGLLKPGDHVITSAMEHNAMARPLEALKKLGVEVEKVRTSAVFGVDPDDIKASIRKNTKLIALTHASNVTGTINPVTEIGKAARKAGIPLLVDAAQTAGFLPIHVAEMNISLLALAGHKSLLGAQGTGVLYIEEGLEVEPLKQGGTGSASEQLEQPRAMPDRYESGTVNTPGLAGLGAGIRYIQKTGLCTIHDHECQVVQQLIAGLQNLAGITVYGPNAGMERACVVSFNVEGMDCQTVGMILDDSFGIAVRPGLHCAPDAHRIIGTLAMGGTVRVSPGCFTTEEEIEAFIEAIHRIAKS